MIAISAAANRPFARINNKIRMISQSIAMIVLGRRGYKRFQDPLLGPLILGEGAEERVLKFVLQLDAHFA
jgi:hypothetical protein